MNCYGPKRPEFLRLTRGAGMLPVVEIDGRVVTESSVIMQARQDDPPLVPNKLRFPKSVGDDPPPAPPSKTNSTPAHNSDSGTIENPDWP